MKEAIMDNPWVEVHDNKAACDIDVLNRVSLPDSDAFRLHFELLPCPFIGNKNAPIYYLTFNPGYYEDDHITQDPINGSMRNIISKSLNHQVPDLFWLRAEYKDSPGGRWWRNRVTKSLREDGVSIDVIAQKIFCVQYFPYHSIKYRELQEILPSQKYNFRLVKEAIKRNTFIILRSEKLLEAWCRQVEGLKEYQDKVVLNSQMTPSISRGNCSRYDDIVTILRGV